MSLRLAVMMILATQLDDTLLGQRLAALRSKLGKTQVEMAQELAISPRAYQNYERGEREIAASTVRNLHRLYNVDLTWLFDGKEAQPAFLHADLDMQLMRTVIEEVEAKLSRLRKKMTPSKKADLILLIYKHFSMIEASDEDFVDQALKLAA